LYLQGMKWTFRPEVPPAVAQELAKQINVDPGLAQLLAQRNIRDFHSAKAFFRPQLEDLHDPFLMKDMDRAVAIVNQALIHQERIMVYGDYDVDGTTSVALVSGYLERHQAQVVRYIPDRYKEGYGLSSAGLQAAAQAGCTTVIALDCGIRSVDKALEAKSLGLQLIICDHHLPGPEIPQAAAVLDPKQPGCPYPYKELSGCGVGFKLLQALARHRGWPEAELFEFLDLLVISIAADIVPMTGENRILAYHGLASINQQPRPGVQALLGQRKPPWTIGDLVFQVAPRINAAGRMEHGMLAVDILTESNPDAAMAKAEAIVGLNENRKQEELDITTAALEQIQQTHAPQRFTSTVYHPDWHKGVIGIVASRLQESHYRPTLVMTRSKGVIAGSGRSITGFNLHGALEACANYLLQFGGHHHAVGFTLEEAQLPLFMEAFEQHAASILKPSDLEENILVDLELEPSHWTPRFWRILQQMAPFGPGNPEPLFVTRQLRDRGFSRQVGKDFEHLKINLAAGGAVVGGIAFRNGHRLEELQQSPAVDVAYHLTMNHFNGKESLELMVKDFKPAQG
jgi:single-stranded-DNA-specific exonuclease